MPPPGACVALEVELAHAVLVGHVQREAVGAAAAVARPAQAREADGQLLGAHLLRRVAPHGAHVRVGRAPARGGLVAPPRDDLLHAVVVLVAHDDRRRRAPAGVKQSPTGWRQRGHAMVRGPVPQPASPGSPAGARPRARTPRRPRPARARDEPHAVVVVVRDDERAVGAAAQVLGVVEARRERRALVQAAARPSRRPPRPAARATAC